MATISPSEIGREPEPETPDYLAELLLAEAETAERGERERDGVAPDQLALSQLTGWPWRA